MELTFGQAILEKMIGYAYLIVFTIIIFKFIKDISNGKD